MASGIPGEVTKVKTSVSVDKGLYEALNDYSQASMIPRSRIINKAIEELLQREYPAYKDSNNWINEHKKAPTTQQKFKRVPVINQRGGWMNMYSLTYILVMSFVILTLIAGIIGTVILLVLGPLYDESDIERDIAKNEGLM